MQRQTIGKVTLEKSNSNESTRIHLGGTIGMSREELQNYLESELKEETELLKVTQDRIDNINKALEISKTNEFTMQANTIYPDRLSTYKYDGDNVEYISGAYWD